MGGPSRHPSSVGRSHNPKLQAFSWSTFPKGLPEAFDQHDVSSRMSQERRSAPASANPPELLTVLLTTSAVATMPLLTADPPGAATCPSAVPIKFPVTSANLCAAPLARLLPPAMRSPATEPPAPATNPTAPDAKASPALVDFPSMVLFATVLPAPMAAPAMEFNAARAAMPAVSRAAPVASPLPRVPAPPQAALCPHFLLFPPHWYP